MADGLCRANRPQVDMAVVGLVGSDLLVGIVRTVEEAGVLALMVHDAQPAIARAYQLRQAPANNGQGVPPAAAS